VALPPGRLRLATRPSATGSAPTENDRNGRSRRFRHSGRRGASGRRDQRHLLADQIDGHGRQLLVFVGGPAIFDGDILAFDEARVGKSLAKGGEPFGVLVARARVQESDHRHRRLLRERRERPSRDRTADKADKFAPPH
jgi:hypothetical protein